MLALCRACEKSLPGQQDTHGPCHKEGRVLGRKTTSIVRELWGWRDKGVSDWARVAVLPRRCGTFQKLKGQEDKQGTLSDQVHRPRVSEIREMGVGEEPGATASHTMLREGDIDCFRRKVT